MQSERKEGVIIVFGVLVIVFVISMFTDWSYGFWSADFGPRWYPDDTGRSPAQSITIKFVTVIAIFFPVLIYGILRATGILRRIFSFEAHLSKIIPPDDKP